MGGPVTLINADAIARSGATSLVDLLNASPLSQGNTGESAAVGGATFGFAGVSLHNLGEQRTLVLLNGHRLAAFGGQTVTGFAAGFDLNAIPLAAIDRIEILRDGASAQHGGDAVAGVVNIITRRDSPEGLIEMGMTAPFNGGSRERRLGVVKGIGNVLAAGDNLLLSLQHSERTPLAASQLDQASSGQIAFAHNGKRYRVTNLSRNAAPANATVTHNQLISPHVKAGHACPAGSFHLYAPYNDGSQDADDYCGYDYARTLEIYPERQRDHLFGSYTGTVGPHTFFADLLLSRSKQRSRIAALPGDMAIAAGSLLHNRHLLPLGITEDAIVHYRLEDIGARTSNDEAHFHDIALGLQGPLGAWRYDAGLSHSRSHATAEAAGQIGTLALRRLARQGLFDPFVGPGEQSQASHDAMASASYQGTWDGGTSTLWTVSAKASRDGWRLTAGPMKLTFGASWMKKGLAYRPSLFAQGLLADPAARTPCQTGATPWPCDLRVGQSTAAAPFDAGRSTVGAFAEISAPVHRTLTLNAALRHDRHSDIGIATMAKSSFRWTPSSAWQIRGAVGTGLSAPSPAQMRGAEQPYGYTSAQFCNAGLRAMAARLDAECREPGARYAVVAGGNEGLRPERALHRSIGAAAALSRRFTIGVDLWHVAIRDVIDQTPADAAFQDPLRYPWAWRARYDVDAQRRYVAFAALNANLGRLDSKGLDVDVSASQSTPWGPLRSALQLTYVMRDDAQLAPDGPVYSALGKFAERGVVAFRWKGRWTTTWALPGGAATLALNYKSGYTDKATPVDEIDDDGRVLASSMLQARIPRFLTVDLQGAWQLGTRATLTLGVLNVQDAHPPFVPSTGGLNRALPLGYDDRYYDPRGRSFYANLADVF